VIPRDNITEWRARAPWVQAFQLGQDLVSSRAVAEIFAHPLRRSSLAFRGGTALYKLYSTSRRRNDTPKISASCGSTPSRSDRS